MRNYLHAFIVFCSIISAPMLVSLGLDWIYMGYGLNPWIAFPLALLCGINFAVHLQVLLLDYKTFHLNQRNKMMQEYLRLEQSTINKLSSTDFNLAELEYQYRTDRYM